MKHCYLILERSAWVLTVAAGLLLILALLIPARAGMARNAVTHVAAQEITESPTPTLTTTSTLTLTPTTTATATAIPTQAPIMTVTPETPMPTSEPTPLPETTVSGAVFPLQLIGILCLVPLLLILAMLVILRWNRRSAARHQPTPPTTTKPLRSDPAAPEQARLQHSAATWPLQQEQTLGHSADNLCVITQAFPGWETVSATHARLFYERKRWIIEDLGSLNGIYINGVRTGRNVLKDGDKVQLGAVEFIFHAAGQEVRA